MDADELVENFVNRVRETARRHRMWQPGQRILVAVSGGPDSVALLSALHRLADDESISLGVAHFHHGLRPEADAEADFVRSLAQRLGLPFHFGRGDTPAEAARMGRGIEAAARRLRLSFLEDTARHSGYDRIALGHTASDRVETVLLNLLRGTGLWGLRGIAPVRLPFIRPLIDLWRADTEAYCRAAALPFVLDRSNLQTDRFLRNKIRHELLPLLERHYRPGAARAILRCAQAVDDELAWTQPLVNDALADCARLSADEVRLRQDALASMPPGLAVRVLRAAVERTFGPPTDWTAVHFSALLDAAARGTTGHRVDLPAGLQGRVEYGWLVIAPRLPQPPEIPERPLPVPGRLHIPEAGLVIESRILPRTHAGQPSPFRAILRADLAHGLIVRGWRPGDRFRPLGMAGRSKKLQDFFTDARVPAAERKRIPLVVHPRQGIIWVVGMRIAEGVAAAAGDENALVLVARPASAAAHRGVES